uniref:Peptidase inhibitor 16-like n=1 Tax=Phallusia mammillata TaxID=59560 RepID=A0A6F9DPM4_9ASCI|nr:peptidase inhibitor 16-like [Phallusia mammillata]
MQYISSKAWNDIPDQLRNANFITTSLRFVCTSFKNHFSAPLLTLFGMLTYTNDIISTTKQIIWRLYLPVAALIVRFIVLLLNRLSARVWHCAVTQVQCFTIVTFCTVLFELNNSHPQACNVLFIFLQFFYCFLNENHIFCHSGVVLYIVLLFYFMFMRFCLLFLV